MSSPQKTFDTGTDLYPDFTLTEDNCDVEPIHRPIAIQGHGFLMCFDDQRPDRVLACSEGTQQLFGLSDQDIWTNPVDQWMPKDFLNVYNEMGTPENWDSVDPIPIELDHRSLNIIRHIHNQKRFIELEARSEEQNELSTFRAIRMVTEPFHRIQYLDELYDTLATQFKKITGYDRVMVINLIAITMVML